MSSHTDTIDLADILRSLRRGRHALLGFLVLGVVTALGIILWAPRKFDGAGSMVIRQSDAGSSLLSRMGGAADLTALVGGSAKGSLETELSILQSRAIAQRVIDSLRLQVRVREPAGIPASAVLAHVALPSGFKSRRYNVDRTSNGYAISGDGMVATAVAGTPARLPIGSVTLRADTALPSHMVLQLFDHDDAMARFQKYFRAEKGGGEVVRLLYRGDDSLTAARVPNVVAAVYLQRRQTTDRGVNEHRVEFLIPRIDSAATQLAAAEQALRHEQESSGVLDPVAAGRVGLERIGEVRTSLTTIDMERGALDSMLAQVARGAMTTRQVAAYPTFIKSSAITQLLTQLGTLDAERLKLLATRTESDPEVEAVTKSVAAVEGQLVPTAQSYAAALTSQRRNLQSELDSLHTFSLGLPRDAQATSRLQRDVIRLSQVYGALQAQLVEARLAAITEGGDVKQLDLATPPKKPAFPEPITTMGLGVGGGLVAGVFAALFLSAVGRWTSDPLEVERLAGVSAVQLDHGSPLLIAGRSASTILVLPLDARAPTALVSAQVAETASARGLSSTVLDLTGPCVNPSETITNLEREFQCVVVRLPDINSKVAAAALREDRPALLVAPPGRVHKGRLNVVLSALRRMDVPCAGVILSAPTTERVTAGV